jgi:hypothetical protein
VRKKPAYGLSFLTDSFAGEAAVFVKNGCAGSIPVRYLDTLSCASAKIPRRAELSALVRSVSGLFAGGPTFFRNVKKMLKSV